jgi:hypothetical protein
MGLSRIRLSIVFTRARVTGLWAERENMLYMPARRKTHRNHKKLNRGPQSSNNRQKIEARLVINPIRGEAAEEKPRRQRLEQASTSRRAGGTAAGRLVDLRLTGISAKEWLPASGVGQR